MLDESTQLYGAKGAVLKYISETDLSIPIQPFVLVPVGANWRDQEKEINELSDYVLVRSSSPLEDGKKLSFAGLFDTVAFRGGDESAQDVYDSTTHEDVQRYMAIHGVEGEIPMGLVFQKDARARWNYSALRHPHRQNIILIQGRSVNQMDVTSEYYFDENTELVYNVSRRFRSQGAFGGEEVEHWVKNGLIEAIEAYRKIESMDAFQTGYTYQMEFGTEPFSVYQFRPFRKKEIGASFEVAILDSDNSSYETDFCFGITPPEGIELIVARALPASNNDRVIEHFRKELSGLPRDKAVEKLMAHWRLSDAERVYAETITDNPSASGYDLTKLFDEAIMKLNDQTGGDNTCLFQEGAHFYHGRGIDLVYPNASALVAPNTTDFMSHNWFRAMQHYGAVLVSTLGERTGARVRVVSNGLEGMVEILEDAPRSFRDDPFSRLPEV